MSTSSTFQSNSFTEMRHPLLNPNSSTLTSDISNHRNYKALHLSSESNHSSRHQRPVSEILKPDNLISAETQALDKWFEDLQEYESSLESMASASLDPKYKEEVHHVDQWFRYLNEAERTSTIYTLLQHSTQVQIKFFINFLQQMSNKDPLIDLFSPAHSEKDIMKSAEIDATQKLLSVNNNMNRHSFTLGDTKEYQQLFKRDFLTPSMSFRRQSSGQCNISVERPKSVIEGDSSSLFHNDWSKKLAPLKHGSIGSNRPKSADISSWSFASNSKYLGEKDAPDIDKELLLLANNDWNMPAADTYRVSRSIRSVIESDESLSMPPTNIVLSSYNDGNSHAATIYSSEFQSSSPLPYHNNQQNPNNNLYGQFLNPNDRTLTSENTGYISDHSDTSNRSNRSRGAHKLTTDHHRGKEGKKNMELVDMKLLEDVPAWLRSLRLHKYNPIFETSKWQDMVKYDDETLLNKGVAALGARRKLLKVFDVVKTHCETNVNFLLYYNYRKSS